MTIWDEIPELIEYTKENPPPKCPKRRFISLNPYIETKVYQEYIKSMNDWVSAGLKILHKIASIKKK